MKKSLLFAALILGIGTANAQLVSKKGEAYLPEPGDWSVGVDATPFLNYAGNFLSSAGNSAPTQNFLNATQTIIGKYFVSEKMAYRGILRIGMGSQHWSENIAQHGATAPVYPALPALVEDTYKEKSTNVGLGGGIEWRRGSTRLQGYYGADLMLTYTNSSREYTYGNALNDSTSVTAISTSWYGQSSYPQNFVNDTYGNTARVTEEKDGSMLAFTLRGFGGVEYFIFPKISLAGEFGWGISFANSSGGSQSIESVNFQSIDPSVGTQTIESNKSGRFSLDTDRNLTGTSTGALRINFHF
ncbi:MAG TPA: hypothetical protein PL185_04775 [Flavobacteriales bacterium]|nr:hypothetical protein [Flavobacteriales bacterium]